MAETTTQRIARLKKWCDKCGRKLRTKICKCESERSG